MVAAAVALRADGRHVATTPRGVLVEAVAVDVPAAKALSGGYVPVGALLLRRSVHEAVFDTLEHSTSHGSTFAPIDTAMVAGLATLHDLEARDLVARSARLGELLLERTRPLVERFDVAKEVRGLGLLPQPALIAFSQHGAPVGFSLPHEQMS